MTVTYTVEGAIGRLKISRPERRNALNHAASHEGRPQEAPTQGGETGTPEGSSP